MSAINADTASFWRELAKDLESKRPSVGKRVRSTTTRGKNKGRSGVVIRHEHDRFGDAYRYGSDASDHMKDMAGTYEWVCLVREDGGQTFWIRADKVEIVEENS